MGYKLVDGKMVQTEETVKDQEILESRENVQAAARADANAILASLAPDADVLFEEREIEVAGVKTTFCIKVFSHNEISFLDAKKYRRGPQNQLVKDVEREETVGAAWQIHKGVLRNKNEGTDLPPNYEPLFSLAQIQGPGMMGNPNPQAQELIHGLISALWDVNPSINPILAAAAAAEMGLV